MRLTRKERGRARTIKAAVEKRFTQREAAERLGLSVRQVNRLVQAYRDKGDAGLISGHRLRGTNNRYPDAYREGVLSLVREHYAQYQPTMAHRKLREHHGYQLSLETVRKWMIADGLWKPRSRTRRA